MVKLSRCLLCTAPNSWLMRLCAPRRLRKKKKKYEKEPGASWGAGDVLSESDAGPVEICLSKLYTVGAVVQARPSTPGA